MLLKANKKHRTYDYTPRFYDPDKEKSDGGERRPIRFRRSSPNASPRAIIVSMIAFALIVYFLHYLAQLAK